MKVECSHASIAAEEIAAIFADMACINLVVEPVLEGLVVFALLVDGVIVNKGGCLADAQGSRNGRKALA